MSTSPPAWWTRALALEAENRMTEAEQLLKESIPHLSFAAQISDLYAHRMNRLMHLGDVPGAVQARADAINWIHFYASQATSGGEGAALSVERDAVLAALKAVPLGDPHAT